MLIHKKAIGSGGIGVLKKTTNERKDLKIPQPDHYSWERTTVRSVTARPQA